MLIYYGADDIQGQALDLVRSGNHPAKEQLIQLLEPI